MLILILTFASLIIDSTSSCIPTLKYNPDENISGIVSSSVTIFSDKSGPSTSNSSYGIPVENAKDYSIVAGISYMGQYYDPQRLCFALNIDKDQTKISITFVSSNTANWTTLVIHYLASKRSDFIIGNALITSDSLPKNEQVRSLNIQQSFATNNSYSKKDIDSFSFLTGINTSNRFLSVNIEKATFSSGKQIVFNVIFADKGNAQILYLQFGYIIYQVQQTLIKVQSIGDSLFQQYKTSYLEVDKNKFIGMTSIDVRNLTNFKRRLLSINTNSIVLSKPAYIQSFFKGFRIRGVSIQTLVGSGPRFTDDGLSLKVSDTCQNYKDCEKNGGILVQYDGILSCIRCRENSAYNPQQKLCKCNPGYYRNGIECTPKETLVRRIQDIINCTQTEINLPQCKCPLPQQFLNIRNQKCQCKPGYKQYSLVSGIKCISCPINQQFDVIQQKCYCPTSIYENNVCCICTDPMTEMNPITKSCECIAGTDKFRERCTYCPSNSAYQSDLKKCQCNEGYQRTLMNLCQLKSGSQEMEIPVLTFRSGFLNNNNNNNIRRV